MSIEEGICVLSPSPWGQGGQLEPVEGHLGGCIHVWGRVRHGGTEQVASSPKRASRSGVTQLTPRTSSGQQRGLRMYAREKGSQGERNARK